MLQRAKRLLLIGLDEGEAASITSESLGASDISVLSASCQQEAVAAVRRHRPDVIVRRENARDPEPGFAELQELLRMAPDSKVVEIVPDLDGYAARVLEAGAFDVIAEDARDEELTSAVRRAFRLRLLEVVRLVEKGGEAESLEGIIAASEKMLKVCRTVRKVAPADVTTLLLGESGTGKELLARALHSMSPRTDGPFVAINCAAIPENLLESELFGYEKGAFTGAVKQTPGRIEQADRGTLFLDEVGDMPLSLQAKLLRFLQERVVERVGGRSEIGVDVRVVCATNQDLAQLIDENRFRGDLYYRISEITVSIPPLREREGEQLVLARHFLKKFADGLGQKVTSFTSDAEEAIQAYDWPGNVREMENRIKSAVVMAESSLIGARDLGLDHDLWEPQSLDLRGVRRRAEIRAMRLALIQAKGNISRASELLGITRPTLYDLMDKYCVSVEGLLNHQGV